MTSCATLIAATIILIIGLILAIVPKRGSRVVIAAFALLVAIGFGMGWIVIVLGLLDQDTDYSDDAVASPSSFSCFCVKHHGEPATMPSWLRTFVR